MKSFFIGIIKTIGWSALAIWCLLTALVIIFLIHRWTYPGTKTISDRNMLDYTTLSLWLLGLFAASRLFLKVVVFWKQKNK